MKRLLSITVFTFFLTQSLIVKAQICEIDQPQEDSFFNITTTIAGGQNFVACATGVITSIRVNFYTVDTDILKLQISSGANTLNPEYTQVFEVLAPGDLLIPLNSPFPVQNQGTYAFTIIGITGTGVVANLFGFNGNPYPGGNAITEEAGTVSNFGADTNFTINIDNSSLLGLSGYYPFNGNANDESGYNRNGTVNGATLTVDRFNNSNSAYFFDGVDDFIELPHLERPENMTLTAWIKSNSSLDNDMIVGWSGFGNSAEFRLSGGNLAYSEYDSETFPGPIAAPPGQDEWHFVAMTRKSTPDEFGENIKLFIDGVLVATGLAKNNYTITSQLMIGAYGWSSPSDRNYSGVIDEVRIYNVNLSEAEVLNIYTESVGATGNEKVAYYPFNGNANDESGHGNNGTVNGPVLTTDRNGNANSAYVFDGVDDYIELSQALPVGSTSNTVSAWIKVPSVGNGGLLDGERVGIILGNYAASPNIGWEIYSLGELRVWWNNGEIDTRGGQDLRDDTWHHVVFVRDKNSNELLSYVDGEINWNYPLAGSDINLTTTHRIGGDYRTGDDPTFHGVIDDISIYNYSLSSSEVNDLYNSEKSVTEAAELIAYYPFNGNANDESGNGYNGTVVGAVLTADRAGNPNSAYSFNGIDNYISLGYIYPAGEIPQNISYTMWVKANPQIAEEVFITSRYDALEGWMTLGINNSLPRLVVDDANYRNDLDGTVSIEDKWTFLSATKQGDVYRLYVNGELVSEESDSRYIASTQEMMLMYHGAWNKFATGTLDDVRFYNGTLTQSEITTLNNESPPSNLDPQLIAYFPFNGNANDESGNGNNGTVVGAILGQDRFDNANSAYYFVEDEIQAPMFGSSSLTISAWVNPVLLGTGSDNQKIITSRDQTVVDHLGDGNWQFEIEDSEIIFGLWDAAGYKNFKTDTSPMKIDQWQHLVGVYDNETGDWFIYYNGEEIVTRNLPITVNQNPAYPVLIGQTFFGCCDPFEGGIDDIQFYGRALSSTEVGQLYVDGSLSSVAPAPTIASFTPASGAVGAQVTISGTNFDPVAANNNVKFNGTTAAITGTPTSTSIITSVPSNATSGKITVEVGGQTATSSSDFIVTVSGEAVIPNPSHTSYLFNGQGSVQALLDGARSVYKSGNYAYVASFSNNALEIIDISDPSSPVHKGSLRHDEGGARLIGPYSVYVSGDYAYVASYYSHALEIVDISNPAAPVHKGSLTNGTDEAALSYPRSVFVSGLYAYIASSNTLEIVDVSDPAAPVHVGKLTNGTDGAALSCPNSVYVSGSYAYVASGCSDALEIVDVSDPANPTHKGSLIHETGGALLDGANSVYVSGDHAYVTSSASDALEIVDVSDPANPTHKGSLVHETGGALLDYPYSVYVLGDYAYVTSLNSYSLEIVDVSNQANPIHKGSLTNNTDGALLSSPYSVYVSGSYAYISSASSDALEIVDITNLASPVHAGSLVDAKDGVQLSYPRSVSMSGDYAYVTSTSSNALTVVNVANPVNPFQQMSLTNGTDGAVISSPQSVFVSGNYAYVANYYSLEILDITNPAAPVHKGNLYNGTDGALIYGAYSVYVSGNYAYLTSYNDDALEIVDVSDPTNPVHKGSITHGTGGALLDAPWSVYVSGNYAYVVSLNSDALEIIDVSNPAAPVHSGSLVHESGGALLDYPRSVYVSGNYAYVTSYYSSALEIVDVGDPSNPVHAGSLTNGTEGAALANPTSVYVSGNLAYIVSSGSNALEIVDVSNPTNPLHQEKFINGTDGALMSNPVSVYVSGDNAFVTSSGSNSLEIIALNFTSVPIPTISSFTPETGGVGTEVAITGTNFSTTVEDNIVNFNGTLAEVTGTPTATSIITTVPAGATTGKISVEVGGQTANSDSDFTVLAEPPPTITSFTPTSGTVGTSVTITGTNFSTTSSENIVAFNGTLATLTGTTTTTELVAIVPDAAITGKITVEVGGQVGTSADDFTVTADATAPTITLQSPPSTYMLTTGGVTISAAISDDVGLAVVLLGYAKISELANEDGEFITIYPEESSSGVYEYRFTDSDFDKIGIEYFFYAIDAAGNEAYSSPFPARISVTFPAGVLSSPSISGVSSAKSASETDYRIFSIPLRSVTVGSVLGVSSMDKSRVRIFRYNGSNQEITTPSTSLSPGQGYWLIYVTGAVSGFDMSGQAVDATSDTPFGISLRSGLNLIGNPYAFPISWTEVINHNINEGITSESSLSSGITTYNGGFSSGNTTLNVGQGGFIQSDGSYSLEFPFSSGNASREGINIRSKPTPLDEDTWQVGINLANEETFYNVAMIGMNPEAREGQDPYDQQAMPYLFNYLEFNSSNGQLSDRISQEFVETTDSHVWEYEATTSFEPSAAILSWDNSYFGDNDRQLYLYDVAEERIINMREQQEYHFDLTEKRRFRIAYGSQEFIKSNLQPNRFTLGHAYPNPFADVTRIPFSLSNESSEYKVKMTIYNSVGELVEVLTDESYQPGFYAADWDGTNTLGQQVSEGIYIYKLSITHEEGSENLTGKLIYGR